eukprot:scaffold288882_cov37-Tisochrysis_lutea.AAC.1
MTDEEQPITYGLGRNIRPLILGGGRPHAQRHGGLRRHSGASSRELEGVDPEPDFWARSARGPWHIASMKIVRSNFSDCLEWMWCIVRGRSGGHR